VKIGPVRSDLGNRRFSVDFFSYLCNYRRIRRVFAIFRRILKRQKFSGLRLEVLIFQWVARFSAVVLVTTSVVMSPF
jgi:uncharacterized protein YecE (DUF72 family)